MVYPGILIVFLCVVIGGLWTAATWEPERYNVQTWSQVQSPRTGKCYEIFRRDGKSMVTTEVPCE